MRLLSPTQWQALPPEVQRRFGDDPATSPEKLYLGRVTATRLNRVGRILAWFTKAIGTPLPDTDGTTGPAAALIAYDAAMPGQIYSRTYGRAGRFPQIVNSVKRFAGPTGLEEFVGPGRRNGIGMTLHLSVDDRALVFRSDRYFLDLLGRRFWLPGWLTPGRMTIRHTQVAGPIFRFTLDLVHPRFGVLVHQDCTFNDPH